jgi:DNA-binding transcriptional LysR family regulator
LDRVASMTAFVRAVETGSFVQAADILGLSAPMVGKHVHSLEQRLGVRLINRTTRRQSLTEPGRVYYDQCRTILADIDAAETAASENLAAPQGRLRVTMPSLLGRVCIAPILLRMAVDLPRLKLEMSFSDDIVDLDDYDLAIRSLGEHHDGVPGGAGMMTRRLSTHQMLICASPIYLAQRGETIDHAGITTHETIAFGRIARPQRWRFTNEDGMPIEIEPHGRFVMDDLAAIADAAAAGLGLAWLPSWLVRKRIEDGELVSVPFLGRSYSYHNHALWHKDVLTPKIRIALDHLALELPRLM